MRVLAVVPRRLQMQEYGHVIEVPQDQFAEGIGVGNISQISIFAHFRGVSGG